jgi:hypothetical protein
MRLVKKNKKGKFDVRDNKIGDDVSTVDSSASLPPRKKYLGSRFFAEIWMPPFQPTEVNDEIIDIPQSFSPRPFCMTGAISFLLLFWATTTLILGILETEPDDNGSIQHYFYGLDHWTLVLTVLYFNFSLYLSLCPVTVASTTGVPFLVRLVWKLFAIVAPSQFLITAIFWILEFDGQASSISYENCNVHGGLFLAVLLEGFVVHRIPLRVSHYWFFLGYIILFLLWTFLHEYLELGNPETEEGYLYAQIRWKENAQVTAVLCALLVLVLVPLTFHVIWMISLFSCCKFQGLNRHYLGTVEAHQKLIP